jgi:hypothetical protein
MEETKKGIAGAVQRQKPDRHSHPAWDPGLTGAESVTLLVCTFSEIFHPQGTRLNVTIPANDFRAIRTESYFGL